MLKMRGSFTKIDTNESVRVFVYVCLFRWQFVCQMKVQARQLESMNHEQIDNAGTNCQKKNRTDCWTEWDRKKILKAEKGTNTGYHFAKVWSCWKPTAATDRKGRRNFLAKHTILNSTKYIHINGSLKTKIKQIFLSNICMYIFFSSKPK